MAQTPISASVAVLSDTPVTLYTVPSGKTAIVKAVIPTVLLASNTANFTVNKNSNGSVIPVVLNQTNTYVSATGGTTTYTPNLLSAPITLTSGESISISTSGTAFYKLPLTYTNSQYQIANITYANNRYMAVGYDSGNLKGLVLTSTDGTTWVKQTFTGSTLTNVCYGNSLWVATSTSIGVIYKSADNGVTWTEISHTASSLYNVTYQNNLFVAVGANGKGITSSDGTTWTLFNVNSETTTLYTAIYVASSWLIGSSATTYKTTNFSSFTTPYSLKDIPYTPVGVVYNTDYGNWYVGLSTPSSSGSVTPYPFYYSSNGIDWTLQSSINSGYNATNAKAIGIQWTSQLQMYPNSSASPSANYMNYTGGNPATPSNWAAGYMSSTLGNWYGRCYNLYSPQNNYWTGLSSSSTGYLGTGSITSASYGTFSVPSSFSSRYNSTFYTGNKNDSSWFAININNSGYLEHYYASYTGMSWTGPYTSTISSGGTTIQCVNGLYSNTGFLIGMSDGRLLRTNSKSTAVSLIQNFGSQIVGIRSNSAVQVVLTANGNVYASTNNFDNYSVTTLSGGALTFNDPTYTENVNLNCTESEFIIVNTVGQVWKSTNGTTWNTVPGKIFNSAYINSIPLLESDYGLLTTADASTFTSYTTTNLTYAQPATNNLVYAGGTYYAAANNTLYSSTNLTTWSSSNLDSLKINNQTYFSGYTNTYLGLASDGTNLVLTGSRGYQGGNGNISKIASIAPYLTLGICTGTILEIS